MTRFISLSLISFGLLFFLTIYATANDKPGPYEGIYPEVGYKAEEDTLDDFEQHFTSAQSTTNKLYTSFW